MTREPRYFVHYWRNATCTFMEQDYSGAAFNHTAGELLRKRGVGIGDFLYGWSYRDGELFLIGRMQVGRYISQRDADALYRSSGGSAWEASDHVLASRPTATPMSFDRTIPLNVVRRLEFISPRGEIRTAQFVEGRVDPQTFRGLRELTRGSAFLLDHLIGTNASRTKAAALDRTRVRSADEDISDFVESRRLAAQGFQTSPAIRKAVERYAIGQARRRYEERGFRVREHGRPFDLECEKRGYVLYVEVKGTQASGHDVILTTNEVDFARKNKMELFLLHSVQVALKRKRYVVSGGVERVIRPWRPRISELRPLAFSCLIPPGAVSV